MITEKSAKEKGMPDKNVQIHGYHDCLDVIPYHWAVDLMVKNIQSTQSTPVKQPTPIMIILCADDSVSLF